MLSCQFAFYGIDINEALRELSGANALELRSKESVYNRLLVIDIHTKKIRHCEYLMRHSYIGSGE